MPLALAVDTLARMMRERLHRRRQGQVVRNLHRAMNLAVHAEKAEVSPPRMRLACACCSFLLMLLLVDKLASMLDIYFNAPIAACSSLAGTSRPQRKGPAGRAIHALAAKCLLSTPMEL